MMRHRKEITPTGTGNREQRLKMSFVLILLRKAAGLSQQELADRIGVHKNTIWRFETGESMTMDVFFDFCKAVGTPAADVIERLVAALNTKLRT